MPIDHQSHAEKLQSAFSNAQKRSNELIELTKISSEEVKPQLEQAAEVYSAVCNVLSTSIGLSQITTIEDYIFETSQTLPASLYDAKEWNGILKEASAARTSQQLKVLSKTNQMQIEKMYASLKMLSRDSKEKMTDMSKSITAFKSQLVPLLRKETDRYLAMQAELNALNGKYANQNRELDARDIELNSVKEAQAQFSSRSQQEIMALRTSIDELTKDNSRLQSELEAAEKDKAEYASSKSQLQQSLAENEKSHVETLARLADIEKRASASETEIASLKGSMAEAETTHSQQIVVQEKLKESIKILEDLLKEKTSAISTRDFQIETLQAELLKEATISTDLHKEVDEMNVKSSAVEAYAEEREGILQAKVAELNKFVTSLEELKMAAATLQSENERIRTELESNKMENEIRLENLTEELESERKSHYEDVDAVESQIAEMKEFMSEVMSITSKQKGDIEGLQMDIVTALPPALVNFFEATAVKKVASTVLMNREAALTASLNKAEEALSAISSEHSILAEKLSAAEESLVLLDEKINSQSSALRYLEAQISAASPESLDVSSSEKLAALIAQRDKIASVLTETTGELANVRLLESEERAERDALGRLIEETVNNINEAHRIWYGSQFAASAGLLADPIAFSPGQAAQQAGAASLLINIAKWSASLSVSHAAVFAFVDEKVARAVATADAAVAAKNSMNAEITVEKSAECSSISIDAEHPEGKNHQLMAEVESQRRKADAAVAEAKSMMTAGVSRSEYSTDNADNVKEYYLKIIDQLKSELEVERMKSSDMSTNMSSVQVTASREDQENKLIEQLKRQVQDLQAQLREARVVVASTINTSAAPLLSDFESDHRALLSEEQQEYQQRIAELTEMVEAERSKVALLQQSNPPAGAYLALTQKAEEDSTRHQRLVAQLQKDVEGLREKLDTSERRQSTHAHESNAPAVSLYHERNERYSTPFKSPALPIRASPEEEFNSAPLQFSSPAVVRPETLMPYMAMTDPTFSSSSPTRNLSKWDPSPSVPKLSRSAKKRTTEVTAIGVDESPVERSLERKKLKASLGFKSPRLPPLASSNTTKSPAFTQALEALEKQYQPRVLPPTSLQPLYLLGGPAAESASSSYNSSPSRSQPSSRGPRPPSADRNPHPLVAELEAKVRRLMDELHAEKQKVGSLEAATQAYEYEKIMIGKLKKRLSKYEADEELPQESFASSPSPYDTLFKSNSEGSLELQAAVDRDLESAESKIAHLEEELKRATDGFLRQSSTLKDDLTAAKTRVSSLEEEVQLASVKIASLEGELLGLRSLTASADDLDEGSPMVLPDSADIVDLEEKPEEARKLVSVREQDIVEIKEQLSSTGRPSGLLKRQDTSPFDNIEPDFQMERELILRHEEEIVKLREQLTIADEALRELILRHEEEIVKLREQLTIADEALQVAESNQQEAEKKITLLERKVLNNSIDEAAREFETSTAATAERDEAVAARAMAERRIAELEAETKRLSRELLESAVSGAMGADASDELSVGAANCLSEQALAELNTMKASLASGQAEVARLSSELQESQSTQQALIEWVEQEKASMKESAEEQAEEALNKIARLEEALKVAIAKATDRPATSPAEDLDKAGVIAQLAEATARMNILSEELVEAHRQSNELSLQLAARSASFPSSAAAAAAVNDKMTALTPEAVKGLIKLQSLLRGIRARGEVGEMFVQRLAMESGTLIAKKETVQGESGWYTGPDGSIYYFVLQKGKWIQAVGPINQEAYNTLLANATKKSRQATESMLTKCNFHILPAEREAVEQQSQSETSSSATVPKLVYMANGTKKLFIVSPIEEIHLLKS